MRILSLNLRGGGGTRADRLADYFCDSGADVVVASEYVPGRRGEQLSGRLEGAGFASLHVPARPRGRYTLLLATRARTGTLRPGVAPVDCGRLAAVRVEGLTVAGVYFNQNRDKATLFDYLLSRPPALGDDVLVIGDWNTGLHRIDEPGATFACADRFALMQERGWVDLWRRQHGPEAREVSWVSNSGVGYRIDHAFATGPVADLVTRCEHDHAPRGELSDHSALIVEVDA